MRNVFTIGLALTACLGTSAIARPTIDFETDGAGHPLSPGTTIAEQYASIGVHFFGSAFDEPTNPFDSFASNTDMKLTTLGGDTSALPNIPAGAGNFLHTYSGWVAEDGDANLAIVFDSPILSCSVTFYDDTVGLTQMFAIDGADVVDSSQTVDTFDGPPQTLTVSATEPFDTVGLILGANNDWVAMDNVSYVVVPEPTMVIVGALGLIGTRRRR